jgi:RNA polymerase sigma factor (sigma-70 family)
MKHGRTLIEQDDPSALLYKQQAPALLTYFYQRTSSWNDAEDLLVEVFLAALEYERFRELGEREQESWLWRVARNKAADHFRRFQRRPSLPLNLEIVEAAIEDEALTPEQKLLKGEEYAELHTVLKLLSKEQQGILELRFGHDLSYAQIATILQKTESAVRMLLFRTIKQLRGVYKKD